MRRRWLPMEKKKYGCEEDKNWMDERVGRHLYEANDLCPHFLVSVFSTSVVSRSWRRVQWCRGRDSNF